MPVNTQIARPSFRGTLHERALRSRALEFGAWLFMLVAVGRVGQLLPGLSQLPLAKVAVGLAVCALAVRWKSLPAVHHPAKSVSRASIVLVLLAVLSVPFSIWRGRSVHFLLYDVPPLIAGFVIVYRLSYAWESLRRMHLGLVASGAALSLAALLRYTGGRASVASMYDTNDLAYVLVTILPLALAFALVERSPKKRVLFFSACGAFVLTILLTASRGGLLGLVAASGMVALGTGRPLSTGKRMRTGKLRRGLFWLLACAIFGAAVWPLLPSETQQRLATITHLNSDYNLNPHDVTGRSEIWKRGIAALEKRPLGYGIAAYEMVDLRFGGKFKAPHDSLVQISVELGILAGILLLRVYWLSYFGLARAWKALAAKGQRSDGDREQMVFSRMLQASLIGNLVSGAFLSMAYATVFWLVVALAMGQMALAIPSRRQKPRSASSRRSVLRKAE